MKRALKALRTFAFRRNSVKGRILLLAFGVVVAAAIIILRSLLGGNSPVVQGENSEGTSFNVFASDGLRPRTILNPRLVYPYSVIPGGIKSAEELRESAEHDPVVAGHYSGFDYKHARIIEVRAPRLVYLSYRRNDKIFWTRRQATLHPGERLLTDGYTTARTRCGNQVSVLPQANISPAEPMMAELERPDAVASGMEHLFPEELSSNLFQIDPLLPIGPLGPGGPLIGSVWPGTFVPLPVGPGASGGHGPNSSPPSANPPGGNPPSGNPPVGGPPISNPPINNPPTNNPPGSNPPSGGPLPAVPEPGTAVLMLSGAIVLILRLRSVKR